MQKTTLFIIYFVICINVSRETFIICKNSNVSRETFVVYKNSSVSRETLEDKIIIYKLKTKINQCFT